MKIFLHIGSTKCSSSSIQQHFSYHNIQGKFAYGAITESGKIVLGSELELKVMREPMNHVSSYLHIYNEKNVSPSFKTTIIANLKECSQQYQILFLSCENWARFSEDFRSLFDIFSPYEVEIIFIIRPPIEWYNSMWWQTGYFRYRYQPVKEYINEITAYPRWDIVYENFQNLPFVKEIYLLTLQPNIIEQLYAIINIPYPQTQDERNNVSSSAELYNFFLQNSYIQNFVAQHIIEFILNRHLKKRSATPWVLTKENVEFILTQYKDDCLKLAPHILNENILENPLWWDVSAYEDKIARCTRDTTLSLETIIDMLEEAIEVINKLDNQIKNQTKKNLHQKLTKPKNKCFLCYTFKKFFSSPRITYTYYRILTKITFGKQRKKYKLKKHKARNEISIMNKISSFKNNLANLQNTQNLSFETASQLLAEAYALITELDTQLRHLIADYRRIELEEN